MGKFFLGLLSGILIWAGLSAVKTDVPEEPKRNWLSHAEQELCPRFDYGISTGPAMLETIQTFKNLSDAFPTEKKYFDIVWQWILKDVASTSTLKENASESDIKEHLGLAKDRIAIGLTDLNGDRQPDIIAIAGSAWCGSGGCSHIIFFSPEYDKAYQPPRVTRFPLKIQSLPRSRYKTIRYENGDAYRYNPTTKTYEYSSYKAASR